MDNRHTKKKEIYMAYEWELLWIHLKHVKYETTITEEQMADQFLSNFMALDDGRLGWKLERCKEILRRIEF